MKFCQSHWDSLRAAIAARGLGALVADSGEKAASNLANELQDGSTVDNFDPLMGAHNAIMNNAMVLLSPAGAMQLMTGDTCPLCFINEGHRDACTEAGCTFTYDDWIGRAADDALAAWKAFNEDGGT